MADIQLLPYAHYFRAAVDGGTVWDGSVDLTLTLHTATYVPDRSNHAFVSDLTNELTTGGGYTAGGTTLSTPVSAVTDADAWTQVWTASTAYLVGQIVRPTAGNGFVYLVNTAGTSDAVEPTWPTTIGQTVVDGSVQWTCIGRAVAWIDAPNLVPAWASFSAGPFRHVVLSDRAPATAATQPLIGVYSFATDQTGGGGNFDITFDDSGIIAIPVP